MLRSFRQQQLFALFVLKMHFSLPQLFVFFFDVLSVVVFVIRERFAKNPTCALIVMLV